MWNNAEGYCYFFRFVLRKRAVIDLVSEVEGLWRTIFMSFRLYLLFRFFEPEWTPIATISSNWIKYINWINCCRVCHFNSHLMSCFYTFWLKGKMCIGNRHMHSFILSKTCILWRHQGVYRCSENDQNDLLDIWQVVVHFRVTKIANFVNVWSEKWTA